MTSKTRQQQIDNLTRRNFVKAAGGCSALTSGALMSTLFNLKVSNSALAASGSANDYPGYKAMVCVFLFGGIDSFNMLIPREDTEYDDYAAVRGNPSDGGLALAKDDLLPITDQSGRKFGLHPGLSDIHSLYQSGNCALMANIGALVRPTSIDDYNNKRSLPQGMFSHADFIKHWQTSIPQSRNNLTGWAGRVADLVTDPTNDNEFISMNMSLSGVTTYETGRTVIPYVVQTSGATELSGWNNGGARDRIIKRVTNSMFEDTYTDLLEKTYSRTRQTAVESALMFNNAVNSVDLQTQFPESFLGNQMKMIAKAIGARETLQQRRQIFFVTLGGWDHHDEVLSNQANMLPNLSASLKAFYDATVELGIANDVVAYTASDFGRTLTSNGRGSDHAWGGNQLVIGGSVNGGQIYGDFPQSLLPENNTNLDVGRGRLLPTLSVDEHAAELALWYGLQNDGTLETVLPNIRNFYSSSASQSPIGFMQS